MLDDNCIYYHVEITLLNVIFKIIGTIDGCRIYKVYIYCKKATGGQAHDTSGDM